MSLIPSIVSSGSSQDQNNKGWFTTEAALVAAYPAGENGWFAIVGSTDTVWIWDADSVAWVDSGETAMGDVTGPASSINNNVTLFDGTTGKIIKDGGALGALAALNSVSATEIDSGAVDTDELASNSVTDTKVATGIDAAKIGAGNVSNAEFDYLDGTTSAIQTQIDSKLDEANSVYMPNYTKYCVDGRDDLATVIASITNLNTVVNISQGSFGGATPLVINKDSIDLIAPPATPAAVEFAYPISTATTADRISMRYLSFDGDFNAGSKRSTYNHCTFNEDLNIQTSATPGYMTFANCEFAAGKTISVQNTYASVVYFINCNFESIGTFTLSQASSTQVIFSNCAGFVSFPTNATYVGINTLTNGFIQNTVTKTLLATGSGASGQMLISGGAGLPDAWETPIDKTNPSFSGTLQTGAIQITTTPVAGYVLESDASGFGSWQPNSGGGGGTVTSITAGTGLSGGTITGSGTIGVDFVQEVTGSGSVTAPANAKYLKAIAFGGGGGGGGSGFSFDDLQSGYSGAGGGGGGAGQENEGKIAVNGGASIIYYSCGAGGSGGSGQTGGSSSSDGSSGILTSVTLDSGGVNILASAMGGSGGGSASLGTSGGVEENAGSGGLGSIGGGGGQRGSYQTTGITTYGSNGLGGSGSPTGGDSSNTASGDGGFNPSSGRTSTSSPGGGGGGSEGGVGGLQANGTNGSRAGGGGGAGGPSGASGFATGHTGGDGGDGYALFIWYFA